LPNIDFYLTWYPEKLPQEYVRGFGNNTNFTGFLPINEFNALLASADLILVLTTRAGIQPSGATEALAFEKPLVISNHQVIRDLFPVGSVYVENRAEAIAEGIRIALKHKPELALEMASFRIEKLCNWEAQFRSVMLRLSGQLAAH
jgi:glycosyltransferase involved in cell wall biosynthesis